MEHESHFDFWYAVNNTHILRMPTSKLETFGNTLINYHLLTELMDTADKVRIREGRLEVTRPEILTPQHTDQTLLEGFGDEARNYIDWLRSHEQDLYILKYGFMIRKQNMNENIISENLQVVSDRVKSEMVNKDDPLAALLVGVDDPWEVCLLKLMVDMVKHSAGTHIRQLRQDPDGSRRDIEMAFQAAAQDPSRMGELSRMLEEYDLFSEYEDRFFALVRSHGRP